MPHPLSHKYPISISQLCLENTDAPAGVGAPPLDTTSSKVIFEKVFIPINLRRDSKHSYNLGKHWNMHKPRTQKRGDKQKSG